MSEVCSGEQTFAQLRTGLRLIYALVVLSSTSGLSSQQFFLYLFIDGSAELSNVRTATHHHSKTHVEDFLFGGVAISSNSINSSNCFHASSWWRMFSSCLGAISWLLGLLFRAENGKRHWKTSKTMHQGKLELK